MIEMRIEPDRMVFLQHGAEFIRYSHRHYDRSSGTESDDLDMRDLAELADDIFEDIIVYAETVAARKMNVSDDR